MREQCKYSNHPSQRAQKDRVRVGKMSHECERHLLFAVSQFFCSLLFLEFSLRSMEITVCLYSLIYLHAIFGFAEVLTKRDISNLCKDKDQESKWKGFDHSRILLCLVAILFSLPLARSFCAAWQVK